MMKLIWSAVLIWLAYVFSMLTDEEQNVLELEYQNNLACAKHSACCEPSLVKNIKDVRITILDTHNERRCPKHEEPCIKDISIKFKLSHETTTSAFTMESLAVHSAVKGSFGYEMKKPLLIKIKQHKPKVFYNLLNVGTVNSDPYEVVYNKHDENFTGCSLMESPTCGICTYEHREIPLSRGFCCSCNEGKNKDDCPDSDMLMREDDNYIMYFQKNDDNYTLCDEDKIRRLNYIIKRNTNDNGNNNLNIPKYILKVKHVGPNSLNRKYRTGKSVTQIRGGQNCEDKYTPPGLDPMTYHDSAHCLRFSKVWYNVYRLDKPTYKISFTVKLYRRQSVAKWKMIAPPIDIINDDTFYEDGGDQPITVHVRSYTPPRITHALEDQRILMPTDLKRSQLFRYPETRNGAKEYLVVSPNMIAMEGDKCDKIGVSFKAFAKQRKKCSKPKGSCLANQPKKLWRYDSDREKRKLKGKYFLKYYLNTKRDVIKLNPSTKRKELHISYNGDHCVEFEIKLSSEFCKDLCEKKTC